MEITNDILYVGVNDHIVDLFEGQYDVPNGMAYNSYLICDDKVAVMDSVDAHFTDEWITKIAAALGERTPDYLVVQHMEPDHSGSVAAFAQAYPGTTIVASAQAFNMMKAYFGTDYADRRVVVKEGDTLPLGTHTLHFVTAPMVHWPEVIMTYDDADKVLFSADAFGKFGALDVEEPWLPEARRYFIGIVGKYGVQVQAVLKKAAALDIETVCSLHGPVLHKEQLGDVLAAYDTWSAYRPETEGVLVAYSSIYGHTAEAANRLAEALREKGVETVAMDLARCDMAEAVAQAFRFSKLVLATPTYNADVFPFMKEFIHHLTERNYQNRTVAFIENGSWAPMAAKVMTKMLEGSKNLTYAATTVTVRGELNAASEAQLTALADAGGKGRAERNNIFAGEIVGGNKAAHGPCGNAPPDGVADEHGVVIVPAVHIGVFQSHSTKALVVVFTGNAAVIVRPVQIIGGIGVRRNDFKQVSTHGVGDGLRYALCSAGGGEIHHQCFARSRYRAGSFRRSSRAGCGFTGSHRRTAHTASGIAGAGSQQQGGSRCASNLQKLAAGNFILHTKHASIYVKCRESQRTAHASAPSRTCRQKLVDMISSGPLSM